MPDVNIGGIARDDTDVKVLVERTEGWPTGVSLGNLPAMLS